MGFARFILPVFKLLGTKGKQFVNGQKRIPELQKKIRKWKTENPSRPLIWFHCASLGEFEQGRPVLEEFKKRNPEFGILLTFFSPSGYEVRKNYEQADFISYLPVDSPSKAKAFVAAVKPEKVVFVKYEFWPNIIKEIKKNGAELYGISVTLRENQAFFKPWGGFFREILFQFDFLFVQNQTSANLLESIGYRNYEVAGDTRFDRVLATAKIAEEIAGISGFKKDRKLMVIGSAWSEDMQVLIPFIKNHPEMAFIIAPHEIKQEQIEDWLKALGAIRYSEIGKLNQENVLIIDSIGLLSKIYKYADYAFVGGAYKTGLHNILEPAVFGIPIFFGNKKYGKFQEALDLLKLGVAYSVDKDLEEIFDKVNSEEIKAKANKYVSGNAGATTKILRRV